MINKNDLIETIETIDAMIDDLDRDYNENKLKVFESLSVDEVEKMHGSVNERDKEVEKAKRKMYSDTCFGAALAEIRFMVIEGWNGMFD